jgi:hypothetical protein
VRATFALYRRRFRRVATLAVVMFGFVGVLRAFAITVLGREYDDPLLVALALTATGFASFGGTFYAGFLDEEVGGELRGEPAPSLHTTLRELPWTRLIIADVLLTVVVTLLQLGLLVPGLVAFTLFGVVGPVINIERRPVRASFARSMRLVWPHFGLVFLVVTLPLFIEHELVVLLSVFVLEHSFAAVWLATAAAGMTVGSVVGLVEVVLAYALLHRASPGYSSDRNGR